MTDALKHCPFCGETLVSTQSGDGYTHNRRIRAANNCILSWVVVRPPHDSAWNTRADTATPAPADPMANPNVQALVEASRDLANVTDDDVEEKDAVFAALSALETDT